MVFALYSTFFRTLLGDDGGGAARAALVEQIEQRGGVEPDHVALAGHDGEGVLNAQAVELLLSVAGAAHPLGVLAACERRDWDALQAVEGGEGASVRRDAGQHGEGKKAVRELGDDPIGGEAAVGNAGEVGLAALEEDRFSDL